MGFGIIVFISLLTSSLALPSGWETCGGLPDLLNNTACPLATATCCHQNWSPSSGNWGCVDFKNATCCSNGYTACPNGYTCHDSGSGWSTVTTCIPTSESKSSQLGRQVCKQGAPLPFSSTKQNVLILGDSVSIGYTPYVASILSNIALVQHTPWGGDGGSEESEYTNQCLDYLLRAPDGTALTPDVLYFNSGMHNINNNSVIPGQSGLPSNYAKYLHLIASKLRKYADSNDVKLIFALTSPYLNSLTIDNTILELNKQAAGIMKTYGIPMVDLHKPIIEKCGNVPQASCFGADGCWSPHCPTGYQWLATQTVAPAIKALLAK